MNPSIPSSEAVLAGDDVNPIDNNQNFVFDCPPGFRFCPYDEELILHYLLNKAKGQPLPAYGQIFDVELYKYNPEVLSERYKKSGEKQCYFFTPREKKYRNGKRPNRTAGDGYWKATAGDKEIRYGGIIIGYKKALVFCRGKPPHGIKTNWIMQEFTLNQSSESKTNQSDMRLDNWVLCKIYEHIGASTKSKLSRINANNTNDDSQDYPVNNSNVSDFAGYVDPPPTHQATCSSDIHSPLLTLPHNDSMDVHAQSIHQATNSPSDISSYYCNNTGYNHNNISNQHLITSSNLLDYSLEDLTLPVADYKIYDDLPPLSVDDYMVYDHAQPKNQPLGLPNIPPHRFHSNIDKNPITSVYNQPPPTMISSPPHQTDISPLPPPIHVQPPPLSTLPPSSYPLPDVYFKFDDDEDLPLPSSIDISSEIDPDY